LKAEKLSAKSNYSNDCEIAMNKKTRVLIVDDSALVRKLLAEILETDESIEVVGTAMDPFRAREKIKQLAPDVLTLDVEMPKMDGLTFLGNLMRLRPMPVVMVSSLTERGAEITLRALELGAVDFIAKPKIDLTRSLAEYSREIIGKIKIAAGANVRTLTPRPPPLRAVPPKLSADSVLAKHARPPAQSTDCIIAIGASTGGTEAIKEVLTQLPAAAPAIIISQHIPEAFSRAFAQRMDSVTAMTVREAADGDRILPGHVYIAPGNRHLMVVRSGSRCVCRLSDGPPVNRHRPSVDVLFRSMAQVAGVNGIGVILTGMGDDGATGLREMRDAGAYTIAQDEHTSVVWGMPGEAVRLGAATEVLPLGWIASRLLEQVVHSRAAQTQDGLA
jgi:two-component system chemotaxis response regulator CheB